MAPHAAILVVLSFLTLNAACGPAGSLAAEKAQAAPKIFRDPAPPEAAEPSGKAPAEPKEHPGVIFHSQPKPLHPEAVTHDWASFLGPTHNAVSTETHLLKDFGDSGPTLVWELEKGTSYASPAIQGDYLVYLHRVGNSERVECLHPETGDLYWQFEYPTTFSDRYGYNNGPRASPGDRRRPRLHLRGARPTVRVRTQDGRVALATTTSPKSSMFRRTFSGFRTHLWWKATCSSSTWARRAVRRWRLSTS